MKRILCIILALVMCVGMVPTSAFAAEEVSTEQTVTSEAKGPAQVPDSQKSSGTPSTPSTPETPKDPATPGNPDTPANPDTPSDPKTPASPDTPSDPKAPANPDIPDDPKTPVDPDSPDDPKTPADPDSPDDPKTPVDPDTPSGPDTPVDPDTTNDLLIPEEPDPEEDPKEYASVSEFLAAVAKIGEAEDEDAVRAAIAEALAIYARLSPEDQAAQADVYAYIQNYAKDLGQSGINALYDYSIDGDYEVPFRGKVNGSYKNLAYAFVPCGGKSVSIWYEWSSRQNAWVMNYSADSGVRVQLYYQTVKNSDMSGVRWSYTSPKTGNSPEQNRKSHCATRLF